MNTKLQLAIVCGIMFSASVMAGITRVTDGGVSINLSDVVPGGVPAVVVFHTPWDQTSITLLEEIESWAQQHEDLAIILVDVVDDRTQVYRQFNLSEIPSIIVIDRNHSEVKRPENNTSDLEDALRELGFL